MTLRSRRRASPCLGTARPAGGALQARGAEPQAWSDALTPSVWARAVESEVRHGNGPLAHTDMNPSHLFKGLDLGLMAALEPTTTRTARYKCGTRGVYVGAGIEF
jgi:hypothetical protein